jgi:hypothetical protein
MIDPTKITNFNLSTPELEECILFWVCAAGKNGVTAAKSLDRLLSNFKSDCSPFETIRFIDRQFNLADQMRIAGIGCFNNKSHTFRALVHSGINLKTCTVFDLEKIKGIGPKTARCFLMHSRPDQKFAGLDTHVLKFLADCGIDVPKSTPNGRKYHHLELQFLNICEKFNLAVADLDLLIWNVYSGRDKTFDSKSYLSKISSAQRQL